MKIAYFIDYEIDALFQIKKDIAESPTRNPLSFGFAQDGTESKGGGKAPTDKYLEDTNIVFLDWKINLRYFFRGRYLTLKIQP